MKASDPRPEPEVVREVRAAVERGRHLALLAADGSGHEQVFREALSRSVVPGEGLQALVLAPSRDAALRIASAIGKDPPDAALLVWPPVKGGGREAAAEVVIGRPIPLLREIRGGRLATSGLKLLCIDAADQCLRLGEWPAAEALLDTLGTEMQRIVASASFDGELADLLQRQLARAFRWPEELFAAEPADGTGLRPADGTGAEATDGRTRPTPQTLWYGAAAREEERLDLLAAALGSADRCLVLVADEAAIAPLASGLRARGVTLAEDASEPGVLVAAEPGVMVATEPAAAAGQLSVAARWGPPDDLGSYAQGLPPADRWVAIIDIRHLAQLALLARRAGWALRPLPAPPPDEQAAVDRFREAVRARLEGGDVSAELLLLQPLLEAHSASSVAAALAALLRERMVPEGRAGQRADERPGEGGGGTRPVRAPGPDEAVLPAWTRIFLNVGKRDGAGPNDILGAITGETGAAAGQIGRIDVRTSYTLVDVDAEIAERVIRGLSGAQIKRRTLTARRAKEGGRGPAR